MTTSEAGPVAPARRLIATLTRDFTELPYRSPTSADAAGGMGAPPGPSGPGGGPLGWRGYDETRARARERTGETESVVCGLGRIGDVEAMLIVFEFGFLGGSIGAATGDRVENAFTTARDLSLPVVSVIASGGSRMQEGMHALTQLQRIARQMVRLRAAGLPHLAVLAGPVTGGGWATLGAGSDVRLALPGAQIGFAGSRVRPADADPHAYTAEAQFARGQVDRIVPPAELRSTVERWLALLTTPAAGPVPPPRALRDAPLPESGWEAVRQARAPERPRAEAYLDAYVDLREPLACTDPGVLCGFGRRAGRPVGYVAQLGTATRPAGFRAATRLLRLADRLSIPVLTLVDTPGAANGADAEHEGVGPAIAEAITAVAASRIPVTTLLVGEGGSGGAVALTAPGRTWVTPDSYYSVIAPELAAAILKRGPDEVRTTAEQLRLRPQDLVELGLARGVVPA